MQRYFAKKNGDEFIFEETDVHHMKNVMRMKCGDQIEVVHDKNLYVCKIESLTPFCVTCTETVVVKEDFPHVTLVCPLLKEQKLNYVIQKATELGISEIVFTKYERSIVNIDSKKESKLSRWSTICKEAAEQSKRLSVPLISYVDKLESVKELQGDLQLICSTKKNIKSIKNVLQNATRCDRIIIVIGPEGGISDREEEMLVSFGFERITLGSRILRVETAPLVALAIINYEYMELNL